MAAESKKNLTLEEINAMMAPVKGYSSSTQIADETPDLPDNAQDLRARVIRHLSSSNDPVAKGFRENFGAAKGYSYKDYLAEQSKNRSYGTEIELCALGEVYKVNIAVIPVNEQGVDGQPYALYRANDNDDTPTIVLRNYQDNQDGRNDHWYEKDYHDTLGDGNCLFHAFMSQYLNPAIKGFQSKLERFSDSSSSSKSENPESFFTDRSQQQKIIAQQEQIMSKLSKLPTAAALEKQAQDEQVRLSKLSENERAQIAADREYALRVAAGLA